MNLKIDADAMTRAAQIATRELKQLAREQAPVSEISESASCARRLATTSATIRGSRKGQLPKSRRGKNVPEFGREKLPRNGHFRHSVSTGNNRPINRKAKEQGYESSVIRQGFDH